VSKSILSRPFAATTALALVTGGLLLGAAAPAHAADRTVGAGGTYATIGEAIAAADPGDVIIVADGAYAESVTLSEAVTLRGATARGAVITGNVALAAPARVSGLTITGSVILQAGGAGSRIDDNTVQGASQLISIEAGGSEAQTSLIEGNTLQNVVVPGGGNANGIFDNGGSWVRIVGNTFVNTPTTPAGSVGVNLASGASHVTIEDNSFTNWENALSVLAPGSAASTHVDFVGNTVTGTTSSALYIGGNNVTELVIAGNAISDVARNAIVFTSGYPGDPDAWIAPGGAPLSGVVIEGNAISTAQTGLLIDPIAVLADDEAIVSRGNTFSDLDGPAMDNRNTTSITSVDDIFNGAAVEGEVDVVVTPAAEPAKPQLPATGVDVAAPLGMAALLALLGTALVLRRRTA